MKRTLLETLSEIYESWGGLVGRSAPAKRSRDRLELYLPEGEGRLLVGTLSQDEEGFVFKYAPGFIARTDLPPIGEFKEKEREYRSPKLFAFFDVRIPPVDRADVQKKMEELKIAPTDTFKLLGTLAKRTVSTPYEFELRAA